MNTTLRTIVTCMLALLVSAAAWAESVEIRLDNGSRWRGELGERVTVKYDAQNIPIEFTGRLVKVTDLYIQVEGDLAGATRVKTIFRADLLSMESAASEEARAESPKRASSTMRSDRKGSSRRGDAAEEADGKWAASAVKGVFYLPMEGTVGTELRHQEIDAIGEQADAYGPGQIIVVKIKSNGGLVLESEQIRDSIKALQDRGHRVVAWVDKAISAGCSLAMCCREIYFMTHGIAGSVTTVRGTDSVAEDEGGQKHVEWQVEVAKDNGYSEHIARAMKYNHYVCSYDKDEETGEVTFYGDLSGEYILSDANSNLNFNASNALHCGFSKGTADTKAELARLLNLPEWRELGEGEEMVEEWLATYECAAEDIPRQLARYGYWKTGSGDPKEIIGAQISVLKKLLAWHGRLSENAAMMSQLPPKETLERTIEELQKQLADIRRSERRR